jgi:Fur family zinc uptake transcriptional regulator
MSAAKANVARFPKSGHNHANCVASALERAEELCEREGQRLTELRKRVLELVWSSHKPIGAYAILAELKDGKAAAPPTVYRALDFLMERGLIHRIESLNAFVGCAQPGDDHIVQFLICTGCGNAAEVEDPRVTKAIGAIASDHGFTLQNRIVELAGLCAPCRGQSANKRSKSA